MIHPFNSLILVLPMTATMSLGQSVEDIRDTALGTPDATDITDAILTDTSADCASYATTYTSDVTDVQQSKGFTGAVIIEADDQSCTLLSNSIPNHDFGDGERQFANAVAEVAQNLTLARSPQAAAAPTALDHDYYDAIMLNGVVVDILSAGCYNPAGPRVDEYGNVLAGCSDDDPWLLDPMSPMAGFAEDTHNGHAQPNGMYHYHANPMALFDEEPGPDGSPVIGFAADGFPIYGSFFQDETGEVRKAVSGYALKQGERPEGDENPEGAYDGMYRADYGFTNAGDLDECNGMTVNGQYGYYVTDSYPWVLACFTGTPDSSFQRRQR